jgi:drug/metabolite transporter (DMT)-like permease
MRMTITQLALTLVCVAVIAGGQVLFKLAGRAAQASAAGFPWDLFNVWLLAAVVLYAAATLLWVWLLKTLPLNLVYPFMGFAFVLVPLLATILLGEQLDWRIVAGGLLIGAGVAVSSWR